MTDFTWPSAIVPTASDWRLVANTAAFISPLSGATRTVGRGGDRWGVTLTINNLIGANRAIMRAFLASLRGQVHRVVIGDHSYVRRGTQDVNVEVMGASQTGSSLIVDGGGAGATLLAGDWIGVGGYLHMVTADATFNGSGQATLSITPPLHTSPADNAPVAVAAPTGRFMLVNNTIGWSNIPGRLSSFTVDLIEDIAS